MKLVTLNNTRFWRSLRSNISLLNIELFKTMTFIRENKYGDKRSQIDFILSCISSYSKLESHQVLVTDLKVKSKIVLQKKLSPT